MNMLIDSTAMVTRVDAAFLLSGGRKAGTPFDTASTPVIAVHPFENAVRMANVASASTWPAGSTDGSTGTGVQRLRTDTASLRRRASRRC